MLPPQAVFPDRAELWLPLAVSSADAQGHGYMLEAVRGAVAYAFGTLGLHRVMADYMPRNRRSAAVLRQAGFVMEGYAREFLRINGRWEDHVLTAITNPDWR